MATVPLALAEQPPAKAAMAGQSTAAPPAWAVLPVAAANRPWLARAATPWVVQPVVAAKAPQAAKAARAAQVWAVQAARPARLAKAVQVAPTPSTVRRLLPPTRLPVAVSMTA
jgi:hypothetical protein